MPIGEWTTVWCVKLLDGENNIRMEYIEELTDRRKAADLKYRYGVYMVIAKNWKNAVFALLDRTWKNHYEKIYDSDLKFLCHPNNYLDCLLETNNCEASVDYDLVRVDCNNRKSWKLIYDFFKRNNGDKHFYYSIEASSLTMMVTLNALMSELTVERTHTFRIENLVFLKCVFKQARGDDGRRNSLNLNPANYFVPCGRYLLREDTGEITLQSAESSRVFRTLPTVTFDIETATDNLIDIPFGENAAEQLVSFSLIGDWMRETWVIVVAYKRFFTGVLNAAFWTGFDRAIASKFRQMYAAKAKRVHAVVLSYATEVELLRGFVYWYAEGNLMRGLTGDADHVHFFTGHNIVHYDLPFLVKRLKWHGLHDIVASHVRYAARDTDDEISTVRFHPRAIVVDTLNVFKKHQLAPAGRLKLKQLSAAYVGDVATKLDVNASLIRVVYIVDSFFAGGASSEYPGHRTRIKKFLRDLTAIRMPGDDDADLEYSTVRLEVGAFPEPLRQILTYGDSAATRIDVHGLDQVLHYNVVDCVCVNELLRKFDYCSLFEQFVRTYPGNVEVALNANVSARIQQMFNYYAVRYNQLIPCTVASDARRYGDRAAARYLFPVKFDETSLTVAGLLAGGRADALADPAEGYRHEFRAKLTSLTSLLSRKPIVSTVRPASGGTGAATKVKFAGAAVFSVRGWYRRTVQFDVVSMYPSVIIAKRLSTDSVDIISAGALSDVLDENSAVRAIFDDCLQYEIFTIFTARDAAARDYWTYLHTWDYDVAASASNAIVGRLVGSADEVRKYDRTTPLIVCRKRSDTFLWRLLTDFLTERKRLKAAMRACPADDGVGSARCVYDSKQASLKVAVNSVYGVYALVHGALAACTTMFGRKILIYSCKCLVAITVDACRRVAAAVALRDVDAGAATEALLVEIGVDRGRLDAIHANVMALWPTVVEDILPEHVQMLYDRATVDGTDSLMAVERVMNKWPALGAECVRLWTDVVPEVVKNSVYDGDTDGLQYANVMDLPYEFLRDRLNWNVSRTCRTGDAIRFEADQIDSTACACRKKYTKFESVAPALSGGATPSVVHVGRDVVVKPSGYEKNALPCVKHLCRYMATLAWLIHAGKFGENRVPAFETIVYAFYAYLETRVAPGELYINVPLNRHKNDSVRKRFIDRYTETYQGSLNAVFVYDWKNNDETLMLLDVYKIDPTAYQLQYAYFCRNVGKYWHDLYSMATGHTVGSQMSAGDDDRLLNARGRGKEKIGDEYHRYFQNWLAAGKVSPFGNAIAENVIEL